MLNRFGWAVVLAASVLVGCESGNEPSVPPPQLDPSKTTVEVDRSSEVVADGEDTAVVTVTVRDTAGNPLPNVPVGIAVDGGATEVTQPSETDSDGVARGTIRSTRAGVKTVSAVVGRRPPTELPQKLSVVFVAGPAAALEFTVPPGSVQAGEAFEPFVQVAVLDAKGNRVVHSSAEISLSLAGGDDDATLLGATSLSAVLGLSTFADLRIEHAGIGYRLSAHAEGLPSVESPEFDVTVGPPTTLVFVEQPSDVVAGETIAPAVVVRVRDAHGNDLTDATPKITLALGANPGSGTLEGTTSVTAAGGVARFDALRMTVAGTGYTLVATAPNFASRESAAFDVAPAAASATVSTFAAGPTDVTADGSSTSALTVVVKDDFGNVIADQPVELAVSGSQNTLTPASGTTDATGTFTATLASTKAEEKTATATFAGHSLTQQVRFVSAAASDTASTFTASPASVTADGTSSSTLTVVVTDAQGNPIAGETVTLTASGSENTLTPASGATDATGTFTATLSSTKAEAKTLTATFAGHSLTQQVTFVAAAASATESSFAANPTSLTADGTSLSALTVVVTDSHGNPIAGETVSLAASGSDNTLTPASGTTDASGTFTATLASTKAEAKTVTASFAGHSLTQRVTFAAGAASDTASTFTASPASVTADGVELGTLTVVVRDAHGNPVAGEAVSLTVSGTVTTLTPASGATDASGTFTANLASTKAEEKTVTARFAGHTLTQTLAFVPGPPDATKSRVTANPLRAVADGASEATISIEVRDAFGNPVPGASVTLAASGSGNAFTQPADTDASGSTSGTLTSLVEGIRTITATVMGVQLDDQPQVEFVVPTFQVGGVVSGLTGTGLVLRNVHAGGVEVLEIAANGAFFFPTRLERGSSYSVTVHSAPVDELCSVRNGAGTVDADVADIEVECVSAWKKVAAGSRHTVGLRADGTLWAWGDNTYGQLGDGTKTHRRSPVQVGSGFIAVSAGNYHTVALKADGTLWAWGSNGSGQLGDGTTADRTEPGPVLTSGEFTAVAAGGAHTLALKADGSVWAFGAGGSGQLGIGFLTSSPWPERVRHGIVSIAASQAFSLAVDTNGGLYAWGDNSNGQFGDGTTQGSGQPRWVNYGVRQAAGGQGHMVAVMIDDTLWTSGDNSSGQIGDGMFSRRRDPVQVGSDFASVAAGHNHTLAVANDGTLWAWGDNSSGQLGDGTAELRRTPVQVASGVASVSAGSYHTVVVKTDGTLWTWGDNTMGQLGDGTVNQRNAPVQVGTGVVSVAAGYMHTLALKTDGTLWGWGYNSNGELGDGTWIQRTAPVLVGSGFASVAAGYLYSAAVKTDGTLWAWGSNASGQLGDGTTTSRNVPVEVGSGFASVAVGHSHTVALKSDGTLWSWGANSSGQLGDGTTDDRHAPVQVGSGFVSVAAGSSHTLAVKADSTLWAWGGNWYGQLGDGTTEDKSEPVQVGSGFVSVATGTNHSLALKADGTLWAWGSNAGGQLGDGTEFDLHTPTQVGSGYASAAGGDVHTIALKTDGTLWAWGNGVYGQLGDGSNDVRHLPVEIGGDFATVAVGHDHTMAVKTDGTLWAWGRNLFGELGDGGGIKFLPVLIR